MSQNIHDIIVQARSLRENSLAERTSSYKTVRYHRYPDSVLELIENLNGIDDILSVSYKMLKQQKLSYNQVKNLNRARELILDVIDSLENNGNSIPNQSRWW